MDVYGAREAVVRFGVFEADLRSGELRKQGVKVKLQEQPFQILRILLEHPGEVVSREELQQKIWPADTFVDFDHGLNNAIRRLREALGDTADTPRFIETLPKRGYRFIGPVNGKGSAGVVPVQDVPPVIRPATVHRRWRRTLAASLVAVGVAVALVLATALGSTFGNLQRWVSAGSSSPSIHSLAVLPLQNLSGDPAQEYFVDGMTEELITVLSRISGLKVISRTSVMRYKKTDQPLPEIARELNVDAIVEGSVLRSGDRVRITAQLIYAPKDTNLWADTYDRDLRDVLTLQSTVDGGIADEIQATMTPAERRSLEARRHVDLKAFESYLQGIYHGNKWGRGFSDEESKIAVAYFQRAIAEDPSFAPVYVELADSCFMQSPAPEICRSMKQFAEKAVALDLTSSHAHNILGKVKWLGDLDAAGAGNAFRQAVLLSRNNAEAHHWLGIILDATNRLEEGMSESQLAQELDPANDHLSEAFYKRGQYDQAIDRAQRFLELDPNNGFLHLQLLSYYEDKGAYPEYAREIQQVLTLYGFPEAAERIRRVYASSGYRTALQQWAKEGEQLHARHQISEPGMQAGVYAMLGDKYHAFQWLQRAYEEHRLGPEGLKCSPVWAPYCSDQRFVDLVRATASKKQSSTN